MDDITDVTVTPCSNSRYIKPLRMHYHQNGSKKIWDAMKVHDSVAVLVFNKTRNVFIFVKQFRPAIYLCKSELTKQDSTSDIQHIDSTKYPGQIGITYELCAGIVDKDTGVNVIAQGEVLEECGYQVPLDNLEKVTTYRSGVGTTGSLQTFYYAEVTDKMKVGYGGGVAEEGEMIDVIEVPVADGMKFVMDESINKPVGMIFAIYWFFANKWKLYEKS